MKGAQNTGMGIWATNYEMKQQFLCHNVSQWPW
jgi:hypothetical protein